MTASADAPTPAEPARRRGLLARRATVVLAPVILIAAGLATAWWWNEIVVGWHVFRLDPGDGASRATRLDAIAARGDAGWRAMAGIAFDPDVVADADDPWTVTRQDALDRLWAHHRESAAQVGGPLLARYVIEARGLRRDEPLSWLRGMSPIEKAALVEPAVEALLTDREPEALRLLINFVCLDLMDERALPALREIARESEHERLRAAAINDGLARIPSAENVPALRGALSDESATVRFGAAWTLASEHRDATGAPILIAELGPRGSNDQRLSAAVALARLQDPRTIEALVAAHDDAEGDGARMVRRHTNAALRGITGHRLERGEGRWTPWWEANRADHPDQLDPETARNAPLR